MSELTINGAFHEVRIAYIRKMDDTAAVIQVDNHRLVHSTRGRFPVFKAKRWCKANFYDVIKVERL